MSDKRWDLFVSYASEDRDSVAAPLVDHLHRAGLRLWFDNEELRIGDSLRERIDAGARPSARGQRGERERRRPLGGPPTTSGGKDLGRQRGAQNGRQAQGKNRGR